MTFQNKKLTTAANPMKLDLSKAVMGATPPATPPAGSDLARSGGRQKLGAGADIPLAVGAKRQTSGEMHPYQHGQTVQDESDAKPSHEKTIPVTYGQSQAFQDASASAGDVLRDASNLGKGKSVKA